MHQRSLYFDLSRLASGSLGFTQSVGWYLRREGHDGRYNIFEKLKIEN
jgi:hypothetical protein